MGRMKEPGINLNPVDEFFRGLVYRLFVNHARYSDCVLQCAFGDTGWNHCTCVVLSPVFSVEIVLRMAVDELGKVSRDMF